MSAVVVGAGPVGLCCGVALARAGRDVLLVDRDPGPPQSGSWRRRGVMQFHHPHFFRAIVRQVLLDTMPDVWDALVAEGGIPVRPDGAPEIMTGLHCRRSTFERVFWSVAAREPGLTLHTGHAERLVTDRGRLTGVVVDGRVIDCDLLVCAAGRTGRFADELRQPGEGGSCGFSYVSRMYRARPGVDPPESATPMGSLYRGYLTIVFPQDDRTLSALVVRPSSDHDLAELRRTECFDAVMPLIPGLAPWTDPARFEPITDALPGGGLTNTYRGQLDDDGRVPVPGLVFVGDAVCTTNPAAGRGVSLGLRQAQVLVTMLTAPGADAEVVAQEFDRWCAENVRPWFEDHVYWDATLLRRFAGEDIDLDAPIPSDVICAAAEVDPSIMSAVVPYWGMMALPRTLAAVEDRARDVLRTGWRPPFADGPTAEELTAYIRRVAEPAVSRI